MKTTEFERALAEGAVHFILFLESTLSMASRDENIPFEIFYPAVDMRNEIAKSIEKYSKTMLEVHGVED